MKKFILLSMLMLLQIQLLKSQSVSIKSGRNLTYYHFSDNGLEPVILKNEMGQILEFGYISKLALKKSIYFGASVGLEEYNASGAYQSNQFAWETTYLNMKGLGFYTLDNNEKYRIALKAGLGLATIVHGRQMLDGVRYDIINQEEFKGLFATPQLGFAFSLFVSNNTNFNLDYDYGYQYNITSNSAQKLFFINHSLSLGISVNIN